MKWITPDFQEVHPDSLNGTGRGQELPGFLSFGPVPSQWILLWVLIALAIGCIFADPFCQGAQAQTDKEAGRCWGRECLFAGWWGFFVLFIGFFFPLSPFQKYITYVSLNSEGGSIFLMNFGCYQEGNTEWFFEELVTALLRNHNGVDTMI